MSTCGIYLIEHIASNRKYVGSSNNIDNRWRKHKEALRRGLHHSKYLQRVWDKYGENAFTFSVLVVCEPSVLKDKEQEYIDALNPELNGTKSANSPVMRGQKLPKEWVEKVRAAVIKRYADGFKVVHSPRSIEYKAKVKEASAARWQDSSYRQKVVAAINAAMTEEERTARKDRTRALWADPEYRAKAVAARKGNSYSKGYKCTPEQIQNRKRAARISNMKRNYKEHWKEEYIRRYPEHAGDLDG